MADLLHVVEYYEGLHKRRQKDDFTVKDEITWILLNGESQSEMVDMYLCLDATLNMDIDPTCTKKQRLAIKKDGRDIYRAIKKINQKLGEDLLQYQDK